MNFSEEEILKYWQENKIFEKSIANRKNAPIYNFYDGPPFATGTPHYGHIVASTMKDVVPRYFTMKGFQVPRVWGWDCHGLPIENIAEKELGIKTKKEIEELGVEKFNNICRQKVLGYVTAWEEFIPRLGRWVDMKNAYKTMDLDYMETVWWVFKELFERGLIYEGYRSMHICPRCQTTLSQSEVAEGYRDIKDLSVIAEFRLVDEPETSILAWTTTPWTLLANVALAVGNEIEYVKLKTKNSKLKTETKNTNDEKKYIIAKDRIKDTFKDIEYDIVEEFKGKYLVGKKYQPLFNFTQEKIENADNGWQIVSAEFVATEEGTGIVHIAPAFGEDDLNLAKAQKLPFIQHIGMDGIIKNNYGEFAGLSVKPIDDVQKTDIEIVKYLAKNNLLFSKAQYEHSYPHCWRCETPLLNYATSSYFVSVEKLKDEAIKLAQKISWHPAHVKHGRFGKWLESARDWGISRQRFWASVIPVWKCECSEIKIIGSIKELEDLSGNKIIDLHKDIIDKITFACPKCQKTMHRVPDVLDSWFEAGSMPYATEKPLPADFIGEGQDQTRCWFYYLHILATGLKHEIAFKNVIVNGIVLAEDGRKMSKRLKNYPDPMEMINKYSADALRLYFLTSSVLQMENLSFSEKDLATISRGTLRMLRNSYLFFALYTESENFKPKENHNSANILDKWILSELNLLTKDLNFLMDNYDLTRASRTFLPFIDNLSNWYIRRSRKRFQNSEDSADQDNARQTLFQVLLTLSKLLAPFAPFVSEEIYQNLTGKVSVHLENYPLPDEEILKDAENLRSQMAIARNIVEQGLAARAELGNKYRVRQPLGFLKYGGEKINPKLEKIITDEINVKEIAFDKNLSKIEIDTCLTAVLLEEGEKNDLIRKIQELRKNAKLSPRDKVTLCYHFDKTSDNIVTKYRDEIMAATNLAKITQSNKKNDALWLEV